MLWDKGTWEPTTDPREGLNKGHLSFILHGERLKGGWDLIRMRGDGKRENWLLIKEKDNQAQNGSADVSLKKQSTSVRAAVR
jgi:bifunctional non-homologous end joining protein LigD